MATTYLTRTATANNNSVGRWTFSCWVKRMKTGDETNLISFYSTGAYRSALRFDSDDKIRFYEVWNSSTIVSKVSTRLFRDTSAWYHIVLAVDKTVSTPDTQIYVNGEAITSWSTDDDYTQNESGKFNDAEPIYINAESSVGGGSNVRDILLSHVHFVDGTTYAASDFGETDSATGEWKIKTNVSVTYGTNGFFILKDGNSVTDQSGNGNNFTVAAGTLTNTEDNPSNVFATLNPLYPYTSTGAFTNGNTVPSDYNATQGIVGTLGASSGKYYFEVKINGSSGERGMVGWGARDTGQITYPGGGAYDWARYNNTTSYYSNATETQISGSSAYTTGDICGCAIDLDNNKIYWYKNGVLENTGGTTITASSTAGNYFPIVRNGQGNNIQCNFGNGFFGTTAITSEGTNASGIGKFEYDVPAGYTALSTKGLNE